jgi:oligopeptide/dipeptide ABC transporter ATP-binding protein
MIDEHPHAIEGELASTAPPTDPEVLLSVRNLRTTFATEAGIVRAVDGLSFDVRRGEVLSIVGESGSGKSVTSLSIMGLLEQPPAKIEADAMTWKGEDLLGASEQRMRQIRGGEIAMIFQDPLSALNPVQTVGRQVAEMARIHDKVSKKEAWERAVDMLRLVGIPQPERRAEMHPHEFSGGMRQRAVIAMAITCNPDLLIADEPTTALDVTVQAQVLDVLMEIKDEIDSSIVLITHDLGVVAGLADRIIVMYAGREAEVGTTHEVFYETRHPYTLGLLASMPRLDDSGVERLRPIRGAPPSLLNPPSGCAFHPRCDFARERCSEEVPMLRVVTGAGHYSACHFAEELGEIDVAEFREEVVEETTEEPVEPVEESVV